MLETKRLRDFYKDRLMEEGRSAAKVVTRTSFALPAEPRPALNDMRAADNSTDTEWACWSKTCPQNK